MLRIAETITRTDVGRHRTGNEDSAFARAPVFAIADGMGGAQSGEVAAQIAIDSFEQGLPDTGSAEARLTEVVARANEEIHRRSRSEAENSGMGTTLTAAMLTDEGVAIAHVGDSRAYLLRDGELRRLTEDHSLVEELLRGGRLTEEQALEHPQRSVITRALGIEPTVEVDTWTYPLRAGDVVLLCSDGLTDMLLEERIRDALIETPDLSSAAERLIDEANAAGGRDNITVVLFRVDDGDGSGEGVSDGNGSVAGGASAVDQPTQIQSAGSAGPGSGPAGPDPERIAQAASRTPPPVVPPPPRGTVRRAPVARAQGWSRPHMPRAWVQAGEDERHFGRFGKLVAATVALLVVLLLVGGGGYLATRQLYFLGTNYQGTVVVYRGLPYVLPFGIPMYETFYVSGVPAQTLPADRRGALLNHAIRDQDAATKLINDLELGKISR